MHITDRIHDSRWGIFNHYLWGNKFEISGAASWDDCVKGIDVKRLAEDIRDSGAHFYFITLMQGFKYMIAPNRTFDEIGGTAPGDACASRDVIAELADELAKYNIDLYLYFTGDGPHKDEKAGPRFGCTEPAANGVTRDFVEKWAAVLEEYAVRYKDAVKGWWMDGCYDFFKYDDELLSIYHRAIKKGNPNAVAGYNNGVKPYYAKHFSGEEITCGEFNDFYVIPRERFIDREKNGGAQAFMLAPLGAAPDGIEWNAWGQKGSKHDGKYMRDFVSCANTNGGVVTIDVWVSPTGRLDPEQMRVLREIDR